MSKRTYQLSEEMGKLPEELREVGSIMKISGVLFQGGKNWKGMNNVIAYLPSAIPPTGPVIVTQLTLSLEEWNSLLIRTDDPLVFERDLKGRVIKAIHRKVMRQIAGEIQQKVWVADGLKCQFCGSKMGESLMTVDHFHPLELGGKNEITNYITACSSCNRDKGAKHPQTFCDERGLDYHTVWLYLQNRKV